METLVESLNSWLAGNDIFTPSTLAHYWDGLVTTVQLVFLALVIGLVIAVPLALIRAGSNRAASRAVWVYTYLFRGTPLLIQLYIIYYGVAQIEMLKGTFLWEQVFREAFYPTLIAFTLNTAAYTTEILRGAITATPTGEIEAAKAYGMSAWLRMRRIILPSAFRRALPAYSNEVIFMLHASAIASVVTIVDITGAARDIYSRFYAPFWSFSFAALIYLLLTFAIIWSFRRLEKRLMAHLEPVHSG